MNRRAFIFLLTMMALAVALLIQRSLATYYAYRTSELAQDKKLLLKQVHALEIEVHRAARPQMLYSYWQDHRQRFEFDIAPQNLPKEQAAPVLESQQELGVMASNTTPKPSNVAVHNAEKKPVATVVQNTTQKPVVAVVKNAAKKPAVTVVQNTSKKPVVNVVKNSSQKPAVTVVKNAAKKPAVAVVQTTAKKPSPKTKNVVHGHPNIILASDKRSNP